MSLLFEPKITRTIVLRPTRGYVRVEDGKHLGYYPFVTRMLKGGVEIEVGDLVRTVRPADYAFFLSNVLDKFVVWPALAEEGPWKLGPWMTHRYHHNIGFRSPPRINTRTLRRRPHPPSHSVANARARFRSTRRSRSSSTARPTVRVGKS